MQESRIHEKENLVLLRKRILYTWDGESCTQEWENRVLTKKSLWELVLRRKRIAHLGERESCTLEKENLALLVRKRISYLLERDSCTHEKSWTLRENPVLCDLVHNTRERESCIQEKQNLILCARESCTQRKQNLVLINEKENLTLLHLL